MSTIRDVARRAGVSTMTVSRVINNSGYISQETRERVEQAISELGYVPNALARSLRFKQTKTLALVLTDITNPFFTTIARGVEDVAGKQGFSVLFCNTDESEHAEAEYLSVLIQKQVDGVLLVPASATSESVPLLRTRGVPVVVLDRQVAGGPTDSVRCDSEQGAYALVQHLIDLGHRRIAMLAGPQNASTSVDRVAGYQRALLAANLPLDPTLVLVGEYNLHGGYRSTQHLLTLGRLPTAIFCANGFIAFGALRALNEAGLRVPDDLSVVTFDDLPQHWLTDPFLTAVNQPAYEIGQRATELLLERLSNPGLSQARELILPTDMVIRRSSGPPQPNA